MSKQSNKQAALYIRVAHTDNDAVARQTNELTAYAQRHGHTDIKVYTDNGVSGLSLDRPAFNKLQEDIKTGLIGAVIVKSISRIGRNSLEVTQWVCDITETGVDFISIMEPGLDINSILALSHKGGDAE